MLKSTFGEIAMKSRQRQKDILFSLIVFFSAFAVNLLIQKLFTTQTLVPMIFVFGVFLISLKTHGYCYGIISAIVSVFAVNFAFTYPYYAFDFFVEESILSAVIMLVVAVSTSTLNIRIRDQEKLRSENEKERMRGNLLRAISHDLRTPLTTISGNAGNLLHNSHSFDDETKQQIYADIYDDSMWLTNLVENLLYSTRIEEGRMMLKTSPELVSEIIEEAMQHIRPNAKKHSITVNYGDDLLMVRVDAKLIVQVIINIVNNAVKYTPPGTDITLSARREGDTVRVEIADTGPGIPQEAQGRLFQMFYTAGNDRGDGRRGLGLGLALCKSIVEAHGGKIGMRANEPHGSVFFFTLQAEEIKL